MRLIDADRLIRNRSMFTWYDIQNAPTIDAVEVVRCYECNFCVKDPCDYEFPYCAEHSMYVQLEDYCSYGERKCD